MKISFEYVTTLEYRLKAANAKIEAFQSGEKYVQMETEYKKQLRFLEAALMQKNKELAEAHSRLITNNRNWLQVCEDIQKECEKEIRKIQKQKEQAENRALKAECQRDEALEKINVLRKEKYQVETELEEEKGKNLQLRAQINRDYENSSIPSSKTIHHKKICNSREKTGRKPGGQPGHEGHCRRKQVPTCAPVLLPPPQKVLEDTAFKKTSKTIVKQLVNIRMVLEVTEYRADIYYNSKTGERCHADFPSGVVDDVNYGGSIRAFLFLLNNECCTSIDKSRKFLSDLTGGKLNISKGMINKLSREFALKSEQEQKVLFSDLLLCPVLHTDCTNAKVNGKSAYVFVCASPDGKAMYFAREKKGHEGVKGTVTEYYQGIIVHDHDVTFYSYGTDHQECLAHILRSLKDSMENETSMSWNKEMYSLLQEMIHYRNSLPADASPDSSKVEKFEEQYRNTLQKAKDEYEYIPPSDYYKDGYNLYQRMEKYMHNHLLFLHDHRVPATNNEAERLLRSYKRKQQQAVTFRSQDSIDYLCQCMSMLVMMRQNGERNIFEKVSEIFG